ncbi:hypothetical protein FNQ90_23625 [Streptomyces alkaliphilus]|uniref:Uncharacterized protein n=1 Tax=Streptomyces alkaliphilus TaxID=1472722 RepID=A0A7W3Y3N4_9ACTN|nr:hypothetical protein [Streptomyces alkaliphilus]MBB0247029.1 hypothetical protein [Streptomyces alkaliphilus]
MTDPAGDALALAEDIAQRLGQLNDHLTHAPPHRVARVPGTVPDGDRGALGRMTELLATGSYFTRHHARTGALPPEVPLAPGRACNQLHDVSPGLDEHLSDLRRLAEPPTGAKAPSVKPGACDMVVRRRR